MKIGSYLVLALAASMGGVIGLWPATTGTSEPKSTVQGCSVTDGDTIRCGAERIRLLGIDAPERPGSCRVGRVCAPGDYVASIASLKQALSQSMTIGRVGEDRYGRTLAMISGEQGDLSCWQLKHGQAIYKPSWDDGLRVARTCPDQTVKR